MLYLGYHVGIWLGWGALSLFLGAVICDSSTTVLAKLLQDLHKSQESFAHIVYATTLVEDLLAIGLIAILTGVISTGSLRPVRCWAGWGSGIFLVSHHHRPAVGAAASDAGGPLSNDELLVIVVLALAFGVSLLAVELHLSLALGAFLIGAITAESGMIGRVEMLVAPLRHMFTAVFFVAIGLLVQPMLLVQHAGPIIGVAAIIIVGKWINCTLGCFLTGGSLGTSFRVGIAMGQVAEFALIIAALGLAMHATRPEVYQVAVGATVLSVVVNPYLIRCSDWLAARARLLVPTRVVRHFGVYRTGSTRWKSTTRFAGRFAVRSGRLPSTLPSSRGCFHPQEWLPAGGCIGTAAVRAGRSARIDLAGHPPAGASVLRGQLPQDPGAGNDAGRGDAAVHQPHLVGASAAGVRWRVDSVPRRGGHGPAHLPAGVRLPAFPACHGCPCRGSGSGHGSELEMLVRVYAGPEVSVCLPGRRPTPIAVDARHDRRPADQDITAVWCPTTPRGRMSIPQLQLHSDGATVVSIERGSDILLNPDGSWPLQVGDRVL